MNDDVQGMAKWMELNQTVVCCASVQSSFPGVVACHNVFKSKGLFALGEILFDLPKNLSTWSHFYCERFFAPSKIFASATKLQRFRRLALEAEKFCQARKSFVLWHPFVIWSSNPLFFDIHPSFDHQILCSLTSIRHLVIKSFVLWHPSVIWSSNPLFFDIYPSFGHQILCSLPSIRHLVIKSFVLWHPSVIWSSNPLFFDIHPSFGHQILCSLTSIRHLVIKFRNMWIAKWTWPYEMALVQIDFEPRFCRARKYPVRMKTTAIAAFSQLN